MPADHHYPQKESGNLGGGHLMSSLLSLNIKQQWRPQDRARGEKSSQVPLFHSSPSLVQHQPCHVRSRWCGHDRHHMGTRPSLFWANLLT